MQIIFRAPSYGNYQPAVRVIAFSNAFKCLFQAENSMLGIAYMEDIMLIQRSKLQISEYTRKRKLPGFRWALI